jgi:hypothetical protein
VTETGVGGGRPRNGHLTENGEERRLTAHGSEPRSDIILKAIPDMIFGISGDFRYLEFHAGRDGIEPLVPPSAFLGRTVDDVIPQDVAEKCKAAIVRALDTCEMQTITYTLEIDQAPREYECRIVPWRTTK